MEKTVRDPNKIALYEKIAEYERTGRFNDDVEKDPPFELIDPDKIDWLQKKLITKIKAAIATRSAKKFFEKMRKKREVIFAGVKGYENLEGFNEGAVITCNHMHHFDNYAILLAFKQYYKKLKLFRVIKDANFALPGILGIMMRNCNTLPINQEGKNKKTVFKCFNAVKQLVENKNYKVLIYPEQSMWWNYRKPRPLKNGAFLMAANAKANIIPCFITLNDSEILGSDGFPVQEFTVNILPVIKYNPDLSAAVNAENMMKENYEAWKNTYEKTYGRILTYEK